MLIDAMTRIVDALLAGQAESNRYLTAKIKEAGDGGDDDGPTADDIEEQAEEDNIEGGNSDEKKEETSSSAKKAPKKVRHLFCDDDNELM